MRKTTTLLIVCLGLLFAASTCFAQTFTTFDVPGAAGITVPSAINPAGQITGRYAPINAPINSGLPYRGFLREPDGTITTFSAPGDYDAEPLAINPAGEITGVCSCGEVQFRRRGAFVRQPDGTFTVIACDPNTPVAYAINPAGRIAGAEDYSAGDVGYVWNRDGTIYTTFIVGYPTTPQAMNPAGQITGFYGVCWSPPLCSPNGGGFVRDDDGTITHFKVGTNLTWPKAITPAGEIAGVDGGAWSPLYGGDLISPHHGFLRKVDGTIITFDVPNSVGAVPTGINPKRQIAGFYMDSRYVFHGFLRQPDGTITTFDVPNSTNTFPVGINPKGQVTGWYSDASGRVHGFVTLITAVPTSKDECKNGGWQLVFRQDGTAFKNQGDCIQYVNTGR